MALDISGFTASDPAKSADANHPIPQTAETVAAFVGRTSRGPVNDPIIVSSFEEYRRNFGGHGSCGFLSVAVHQFFQHGGRFAAIVRVTNNATRATLKLRAGEQHLRLIAREPGSQTVLRASVDYDGLSSRDERFNLVIQRLAKAGSHLVEDQELFRALSMDESDGRFVVDILRSSALIQLGGPLPERRPDATRAEHPGQPLPYVDLDALGDDGDELTDYDIIGSNDERTGLFALDDLPSVDLINIPLLPSGSDFGSTTFLAAERYCARRRAMLIWDPPWSWTSPGTALLGLRSGGYATPNAMTYYPRVSPAANPERHPHGIPAGGAVAGLLAAIDRTADWHVDGDLHRQLRAGLVPQSTVERRDAQVLVRRGVNVFSARPPHGALLIGNMTLASTSGVSRLWQRLDRRRMVAFVLKSLERHTRWALRAQWNRTFEQRLVAQVTLFLEALFDSGAFAGRRPEQAFFVKLQAALQGEDRELVLRVGLALERPGDFLEYDIVHTLDRSVARPAPPQTAAQLAG